MVKTKKIIKFTVISFIILIIAIRAGDLIQNEDYFQIVKNVYHSIRILLMILFLGNTTIYYIIFLFAFLIGKKELKFFENKIFSESGYLFVPISDKENKEDIIYKPEWEKAKENNWIVFFSEKTKNDGPLFLRVNIFLTFVLFAGIIIKNYIDIEWYFHDDNFIVSSLINALLMVFIFFLGISWRASLFERKLTCNWGRSNKPRAIDGYLCTKITHDCIYLCPIWNLHEFSLKKAEEFYDEFKKEYDFVEKRSQIIGLEKRKSVK